MLQITSRTAPSWHLPEDVTWTDGGGLTGGSGVMFLRNVLLSGQDIRTVEIHLSEFWESERLIWQQIPGFNVQEIRNGDHFTLRITTDGATNYQWEHFLRLIQYDADANGPWLGGDLLRRVQVSATNAVGEIGTGSLNLTVDIQRPNIDIPYEGQRIDAILHDDAAYLFPTFGERALGLTDPEESLKIFDVTLGWLEADQTVHIDTDMAQRLGLAVFNSRNNDDGTAYLQITPLDETATMTPEAVTRLLQTLYVTASQLNPNALIRVFLVAADDQQNLSGGEYFLDFANARQADDAPAAEGVGNVEYISGGEAVALLPDLTLTDADSLIQGASLTLQGWDSDDRLMLDADLLGRFGLTVRMETLSGEQILTISGAALAQDYQQILRSLAFARGDAVAAPGQLAFTLKVQDVSGNETQAEGAVALIPNNRAPEITTPDEGTNKSFVPSTDAYYFMADLAIVDPDSDQSIARADLTFSNFIDLRQVFIAWSGALADQLGIKVLFNPVTDEHPEARLTLTKLEGSQASDADFAILIKTIALWSGPQPEASHHSVSLTVWDTHGAFDTARYNLTLEAHSDWS